MQGASRVPFSSTAEREWAERFADKPLVIDIAARIPQEMLDGWMAADMRFAVQRTTHVRNRWLARRVICGKLQVIAEGSPPCRAVIFLPAQFPQNPQIQPNSRRFLAIGESLSLWFAMQVLVSD